MIWLCVRCGEPFCDNCADFDTMRGLCEGCIAGSEPDPDLERKVRLEAGL